MPARMPARKIHSGGNRSDGLSPNGESKEWGNPFIPPSFLFSYFVVSNTPNCKMKTFFITLALVFGLSSGVLSQTRDFHPLDRWKRHPHQHKNPICLTIYGTFRMGLKKPAACEVPETYKKNHIDLIKTDYPTRKYYLTVTINSLNSGVAYTDINYAVQFYTRDGVYEGMQSYITHDTIEKGKAIALKEQRLKCPKDCKTINVAFISATEVVKIQE
jgi:hypothetical protein